MMSNLDKSALDPLKRDGTIPGFGIPSSWKKMLKNSLYTFAEGRREAIENDVRVGFLDSKFIE